MDFEEGVRDIQSGKATEVLSRIQRTISRKRFSELRDDLERDELLALLRLQGIAYFYLGDMDSSISSFREMHSLAKKWNDVKREIEALIGMGTGYAGNYQLIRSIECLEKARNLAREARLEEYMPVILSNLSHSLRLLGNLEGAEQVLHEEMEWLGLQLPVHDLANQPRRYLETVLRLLGNLSRVFFDQGEVVKSLFYLEESLKIADYLEIVQLRVRVRLDLAMVLAISGQMEKAMNVLQEAKTLSLDHDGLLFSDISVIGLEIALMMEDVTRMARILDEWYEWFHDHPDISEMLWYFLFKVEEMLIRGQQGTSVEKADLLEEAREILAMSKDLLSRKDLHPESTARYHLAATKVALESGDLQLAHEHAERALQLFLMFNRMAFVMKVRLILALINALDGRETEARTHLNSARQDNAKFGFSYLQSLLLQVTEEVETFLRARRLFALVNARNNNAGSLSSSAETVKKIQRYIMDVQHLLASS